MTNTSTPVPTNSPEERKEVNCLDPDLWECVADLVEHAKTCTVNPMAGRTMEPAVLVQRILGGMWPSTPHEVFTEKTPPFPPSPHDEITIDLMGTYCPDLREVTIYTQRVRLFSKRHEFWWENIEFIVRVHEYAHALVHIGVLGDTNFENEATFLSDRRTLYGEICATTHELLAQSVTWFALQERPDIRKTFESMLVYQPPEYQLTPELKANLSGERLRRFLRLLHYRKYFTRDHLQNTAGVRAAFEKPPDRP